MAKGEDITTKFKVDISDLKKGITEANNQIKMANSAFNKASAGMDDWAKSSDGIKAKLEQLKSVLESQTSKLKNYEQQLTRAKNSEKEASNEILRLKQALEQAKKTYGENSNEVKLLQKELSAAEKAEMQMKNQVAALTVTMNNQEATVKKTEKEMNNLEGELKDVSEAEKIAAKTGKSVDDVLKEMDNTARKTSEGFTVVKGALASLVADGIRTAVSALKDFVKETYTVGSEFGSKMSQVKAISGATGAELEALRDKAVEMGAKTKFSAGESADAFNYMAMAGWKTEDMLNGIEGIMNLAAASGSDLATASDIVTDALTAMGYSAKDAGRLADVMAAASSNANTNVEMMGETFKYAAPLAGALGYSMEDTAIAIGLMANSGIKATQAGTSLRSIFQRLSTNTAGAKDAFKTLGGEMTNSDGTMRSLGDVMSDLRKGFSKLSEEEQVNYAKTIAGQEAMGGLLAIVNASDADFNKLTIAVNNSAGAAEKMAKTMQDNLHGDMEELGGQIETIQLSLFQKLEPAIRKIVKGFKDWVSSVDWEVFGSKIKHAVTIAVNVIKTFVDIIASAIKLFNTLKPIIIAVGAAIVAYTTYTKAATIATTAYAAIQKALGLNVAGATAATVAQTVAQKGLNLVMSANPVGLVIAGVTALTAGIIALIKYENEETKALKEKTLVLQDETEKVQDLVTARNDLKKSVQETIANGTSELNYVQSLKSELDGLIDKNGKVKQGYEGRAKFIVGELSKATGTEISLIDGQIKKYDALSKKIDEIIEKKKAELVIEANSELYKSAIQTRQNAYNEMYRIEKERLAKEEEIKEKEEELLVYRGKSRQIQNKKQLKELEKQKAELDKQYKAQQELADDNAYIIGSYEQQMVDFQAGAYDKIIANDINLNKHKSDKNKTEQQIAKENYEIAKDELENLKKLKSKAKDDEKAIYDQQIKNAQKNVDDTKSKLSTLTSTVKSGMNQTTNEYLNGVEKSLSAITGKKVEFKNAGFGQVQMYVDGVASGKPKAISEMNKLANESINKVKSKKSSAKEAGEYLIDGVNSGIKNQNKQSSVFASIASFGSKLLTKLKNSLKEKSPSKATEEMGQFLLQGLGIGIEDEENGILKQVTDFGKNVISKLQNQLNSNVEVDNLKKNLENAIGNVKGKLSSLNSISVDGGYGKSNSVTNSNVNNFTQIINAPKQPSRIELYRQTKNLLNLKGGY